MQLSPVAEHLFQLLRAGLHPERKEQIAWHEAPDWAAVYRLATEQGVAAIAWDGVARLRQEGRIEPRMDLPRGLKLQWAMQVEQVEQRYEKQFDRAKELAAEFFAHGVRTVVLKGFAISELYPNPTHRECGDLDCFLCGDYEKGNRLAEQCGAHVERDYYKHSHISYKGLMVENHQFCTAIRGRKERKAFECYLQNLLKTPSDHVVRASALEIPSSDFNALFLTAHGMSHFMSEGLKLRHLCDWMLLVQHKQQEIYWKAFYRLTDQMSYTRFSAIMTALSVKWLGLRITEQAIQINDQYADRFLSDMLWSDSSIYNSGKSRMKQRVMLITNRWKMIWKYWLIYRRSMLLDLGSMVWAFFFERNPKLT